MRELFDDAVVFPTRIGLMWCSVGEYQHPDLDEPREMLNEWDNTDTVADVTHAETVWYLAKDLLYATWPEHGDAVAVFNGRHISIDNIVHICDPDNPGVAVWLGHVIGQDYRWWEHHGWEVTRIQRVDHPGHSVAALMFGGNHGGNAESA